MKKNGGRKFIIGIASTAVIVFLIAFPPLFLHTSTYPVAVVNGNSMYPMFRDGELVIFSLNGVNIDDIPNGTVIVYVQTETGLPMFSAITAHPVAHQIIGRIVNPYGGVYYKTKGINNLYPDPLLVPASHVLGVVIYSIPYAGYPFLYASQPGGMIAIIGVIVIMYIGSVEKSINRQKERQKFIGELSKLVIEGKLSEKRFNEMKMVVEYAESYDNISDPLLKNLNDLAKKDRLRYFHIDGEGQTVKITDGKKEYVLWESKISSVK